MGKVSVVTVVRTRLRYYLGRETQAPTIAEDVQTLARSCVKAAKKMLRLFEEIRSTGNLTRFSFTDFQACSIATIVVILAGILERDASYERQVSFGLECLQKMAEGNVTAKMGVSFVEALQSIANEAVEKLHQTETHETSSVDKHPPQQADYSSWADWLSRQSNSSNISETTANQQRLSAGPSLQSLDNPTWPTPQAQSSAAGFSSWEGATALQQLSVPPLATVGLAQNHQGPFESHTLENSFLSTLYNDDQAFLMGLTGFDVLGFSELQDEL